jgi:hypothetical protein
LQEVAFIVDRVSGCAIEARRKYVTLPLGRDLPDEIAKVCDIDIADKIGRYTPVLWPSIIPVSERISVCARAETAAKSSANTNDGARLRLVGTMIERIVLSYARSHGPSSFPKCLPLLLSFECKA